MFYSTLKCLCLFCSLQIRAANLSGDCSFVNEISRFNFGLKEHHQVCSLVCVLWMVSGCVFTCVYVLGVCSRPSAALHPRRSQGEPRGGGASGWRGVWQLFPWPRPLRPHPTQQERRQVRTQRLRDPRPILRKPLRNIRYCAVHSCSGRIRKPHTYLFHH